MSQPQPFIIANLDSLAKYTLPLVRTGRCDNAAASEIKRHSVEDLFPNARNAKTAYSALLLLFGCWEESHDLINEDESTEVCHLHAIIHRMEPDAGNSAYWYRRVHNDILFEQLREKAQLILSADPVGGWRLKPAWDPYQFNAWCEDARAVPGGEKERVALAIQRAEFDLLFAWCISCP